MPNPIQILEADVKAGWTWIKTEAAVVYNGVVHLVSPLFAAFDSTVLADFWGACAAFVTKLTSITNLADAEQAFLMAVESLGGTLWAAIKTFASQAWSNLLQSLLGVLSAHAASVGAT